MTDCALLEAAARAAGIGWDRDLEIWYGEPFVRADWNPLTDDGDALRLAVKCGIKLELHPLWVYARAVVTRHEYMDISEGWANGGDPYAATRRAIVRAAAALDKP